MSSVPSREGSAVQIFLVSDSYYPLYNSCARQIHDLAKEMQRLGHQVTILTPSTAIPGRLAVTEEQGIRIARVQTPPTKEVSRVSRAFNESRLSSIIWRNAGAFLREQQVDLIVWYSPTIFFGGLIKRLKRLWRCPAYLILRDIFPEWAVETGLLKRGLIYRFFRAKAIEQYRAADLIGVETKASVDYFRRHYSQIERPVEVLHNWIEANHCGSQCRPGPNERADRPVRFFYGGNMGVAQDMQNVLRLATSLRDLPAQFILVGRGEAVPEIQRTVRELALHNVDLHDAVSESEYMELLAKCDVGLVTLDRRLKTRNVPGKLLSYLKSGKPVLASLNPDNDLAQILRDSGAGFVSINGENDRFSEHAITLIKDPGLRERMGRNALQLLEATFSVERAAAQILRLTAMDTA